MPDALIVFAKVPEVGNVKTRLASLFSLEEAAALYRAFLLDALHQYARLPVDMRLYLDESERARALDAAFPDEVFYQQGASLGERMARAFAESFAAGYGRLVIIGTDHPTLPDAFIELAFDVLERPLSVCIGPASDGGYYLLGMNDLMPHLFEGMTFSHAGVLEQTLVRAQEAARHLTVLPEWYDVDTPNDLHRLAIDLSSAPDSSLPETRRMLRKLRAVYPQFFEQHRND